MERPPRYIAFDLSLNSTGICMPDDSCRVIKGLNAKHPLQHRLANLFHQFKAVLQEQELDRVVKEGTFIRPGRMSGQANLIMVHGILVAAIDAVFDGAVGLWEVSPTELKKFATGKGNADKQQMIEAARKHGYLGNSDDEADALLVKRYFQGLT